MPVCWCITTFHLDVCFGRDDNPLYGALLSPKCLLHGTAVACSVAGSCLNVASSLTNFSFACSLACLKPSSCNNRKRVRVYASCQAKVMPPSTVQASAMHQRSRAERVLRLADGMQNASSRHAQGWRDMLRNIVLWTAHNATPGKGWRHHTKCTK